ncbi:NACHT domain-containing NTPase [Streptomyces phytohabitans]|uniref:NACHT domain-containing protein n=1 Tax=Streptomyces phytohabitans TaxID=1150371 RepID=UPI00345B79E8
MSLLLAWWLIEFENKEAKDELIGVVGMFAGLGSLVAALAQFVPPPPPPPDATEAASQLAVTVREQWSEEVGARQLREPAVIPLSWAGTDRPVTVRPETIVGPHAGRITRLALNGRLEGGFDHAATQLAAGFRQVPSGRLMVLGEPGAGKTVLAIMLTLGLLTDLPPNKPVPVLLSVSGWDPVSESLDDFIVASVAASYYGGQPQTPRLLLDRRLLLPVLDGLDEMPEAARRNAVRGLNEACGDGRGVVVTCRSAEYQDVIEGGSPLLRKAPVVEIQPVSVPDTIAYLSEVNWPEQVDWEPVYTHLRQHPDGPAATALSTPLALSLARGVYRNCDRNPGELLDFEGRHAIEDHLVDHIIPAAYAPPPGTLLQQADDAWQVEARKAERWLKFLATYLHQHRERDLAWWLMSHRLLSRWSGLLIGIGIGLVSMLLMLVVLAMPNGFDEYENLEYNAIQAGVVIALLATLTWYAAPDRRPGRTSFTLHGSLHRLRGGFRTGFALTSLASAMVLGLLAVVTALSGTWNPVKLTHFYTAIAWALGAATAMGLAFAIQSWLNAPLERSTPTTPKGMIHQDQRSSLLATGVAGIVLGATALPLLVLTHTISETIFYATTNWSGIPPITEILAQSANSTGTYDEPLEGFTKPFPFYERPLAITAATVLPGAIFALLMLLPRASTRFVLLRLALARKGQLPWKLVPFLEDARSRQLLRQSGGRYQFRHIRLQERLASQSLAQNRTAAPRPRNSARYRLQAIATAFAIAASVLLVNQRTFSEEIPYTVLPTSYVDEIAFGPPETDALVTVSDDGTVQRWNTQTGKSDNAGKLALKANQDISLGASKDGVTIVTVNEEGASDFVERVTDLHWEGPPTLRNRRLQGNPLKGYGGDEVVDGQVLLLKASGKTLWWDLRDTDGENSPLINGVGLDSADQIVKKSDNGTMLVYRDAKQRTEVFTSIRKPLCALPGDQFDIPGMDASGGRFATFDGEIVDVWDGLCVHEDLSIAAYDDVRKVALNADGTQVAVTIGYQETRIYTLPSSKK